MCTHLPQNPVQKQQLEKCPDCMWRLICNYESTCWRSRNLLGPSLGMEELADIDFAFSL